MTRRKGRTSSTTAHPVRCYHFGYWAPPRRRPCGTRIHAQRHFRYRAQQRVLGARRAPRTSMAVHDIRSDTDSDYGNAPPLPKHIVYPRSSRIAMTAGNKDCAKSKCVRHQNDDRYKNPPSCVARPTRRAGYRCSDAQTPDFKRETVNANPRHEKWSPNSHMIRTSAHAKLLGDRNRCLSIEDL